MQSTQTCSVTECIRPRRSSGQPLCETHYYRVRRNGMLEPKPRDQYKPRVTGRTGKLLVVEGCAVTDCERPAVSWAVDKHVCVMHWKRWKRRGTFEQTRKWSPPNPNRRPCAAEGCNETEDGACGYCKRHDSRIRRNGEPYSYVHQRDRNLARGERNINWTGESATYTAMHQRVRAARGRARIHACIDCGATAAHWSYNRSDPQERSSEFGPYSIDIAQYVPRCVKCHKQFDMQAIRSSRVQVSPESAR